MDFQYVDHATADELTVLRSLADVHRRITLLGELPFRADNSALISECYREAGRIIERHDDMIVAEKDACKEAVGIIVGRFQVPQLHAGHKYIIETVRRRHRCYGIAVGSASIYGRTDHPLTYHMRVAVITEEFGDCVVLPIEDRPDDRDWSADLDRAIRVAFPVGAIRLYGGRESFIPKYSGQFPTSEISAVEGVSGTAVRGLIGNTPENNVEFRRGIVFATQAREATK